MAQQLVVTIIGCHASHSTCVSPRMYCGAPLSACSSAGLAEICPRSSRSTPSPRGAQHPASGHGGDAALHAVLTAAAAAQPHGDSSQPGVRKRVLHPRRDAQPVVSAQGSDELRQRRQLGPRRGARRARRPVCGRQLCSGVHEKQSSIKAPACCRRRSAQVLGPPWSQLGGGKRKRHKPGVLGSLGATCALAPKDERSCNVQGGRSHRR